jgi:plastocyanin
MKRSILLTVNFLMLSLLFIQCSKSDSGYNNGGSTGTGNTININGMTFSPASKTVPKGTVVTWKNNDSNTHTATSNDGTTFDTGNIAAGGSATYTANTAGTFNYHCTIHGLGMSGTLIVTP